MQQSSDDLIQNSNEAIQHYLNMPDLLKDLLLQVTKDFQTAQIPLALDSIEYCSFEGLCDKILMALDEHLAKGGTLKNVLNRVDLTEKQLKKYIPNRLNNNLRALSELIIKRELQKVVIRYWYKQSSEK
ncbi:hypothetical protein [Runella sp.]|uniref:hypothetical protein n=1 Tax=Runella sp. TaxID=1960881 RepID=UPI003D128988